MANPGSVEHHWDDLLLNDGITGFAGVGSDKGSPTIVAAIALGAGWGSAVLFDLFGLPAMFAGDCF